MVQKTVGFDEQRSLESIRHYLPSQAALKDFVHHNTLHAFQQEKFHDALRKASVIFGYTTYLSVDEFRKFHKDGQVKPDVLERVISAFCAETYGSAAENRIAYWRDRLLDTRFDSKVTSRVGELRKCWKENLRMNMDKATHPLLLRILSSYLDQGIALWKFPVTGRGFLDSLRLLEQNGFTSIFKTSRPRNLLLGHQTGLTGLLKILVGSEALFGQYLFDQQFAHPGWSGFVSMVESQPETLLSPRKISLHDLVFFELLLEIDALDDHFGESWEPLSHKMTTIPEPLFDPVEPSELHTVLRLWQEAYEWSYFDGVLSGIRHSEHVHSKGRRSFQALFCIDDREYSFRRHVERVDPDCETFATPGFFGVEFYFQPENGKFHTKACPAPVTPAFLIKEKGRRNGRKTDLHFHKQSHSLIIGWLTSATLGFWSALKLFAGLLKPSVTPAMAYSFSHMDKYARLEIKSAGKVEHGLKVGFTTEEMAVRVSNVLKSIGLTSHFAPIIYVVGHGGSSVNNPYYAGYDCGACCGRPGAVNARVFAYMANRKSVRDLLSSEGIDIPGTTVFIGAMHDTTRDEMEFYDADVSSDELIRLHTTNEEVFQQALIFNARERAYRFDTLKKNLPPPKLHREIRKRSVSLFEPRPEWNHTDNALCIVGRKSLYDKLYLDKRPFINSYDYGQDPDGKYLLAILNAAIPVCGGINLEYYFSRVDQQNLGAGTKLPHNVVGLFAVNNGIEGDLRPGLPSQMIEIHAAVRILFIIEQLPGMVLNVIRSNPVIYEWIVNEWVLLTVKNPLTQEILRFKGGAFEPYHSQHPGLRHAKDEEDILPVIRKAEPAMFMT